MSSTTNGGSHEIISCVCEFQISPKCRKSRTGERRDFETIKRRNSGKYICIGCSRMLKSSGRNNSNARYKLNDGLFNRVDTEAKAYLLGIIASDGSLSNGTVAIELHKKDEDLLCSLKQQLGMDIPLRHRKDRDHVTLRLHSKEIVRDAARLLGLNDTCGSFKKDRTVKVPSFETEALKWAFVRGYFDGNGSIAKPSETCRSPKINISSLSPFIREEIASWCGIPCRVYPGAVVWTGVNALDMLGKMYDNASIYMSRKRDLFYQWALWKPTLPTGDNIRGRNDCIQWAKTRPDAVKPSKVRVSDSGYDVTILDAVKTVGDVTFYSTGIKVRPPFGYYFDLVPRSSIAKSGYMLANSVGIIDRSYTGEVIVPLRKIDKNAADLVLPCKIVQLILRNIVHVEFEQVEALDATDRGNCGFGSTNT